MIYNYEASILKYVNELLPEIKTATYAKSEELFESMISIKKLPIFYYTRETTQWDFPKIFTPLEGVNSVDFSKVDQVYTGRIYVTTQGDALELASKLRFKISKTPYVMVKTTVGNIRVSLRLLYIKIEEDRRGSDTKGPLRYVEFQWSSVLFMSTSLDVNNVLVEKVKVYLNDEDAKLDENNLIKIVY